MSLGAWPLSQLVYTAGQLIWLRGGMLNYRGSLAMATSRLSRRLFARTLTSSAPQIKPFEEMPTATVWDRLRFISPRNMTRRHKLMQELHRKHGKMFKLHFPGLKHTQVWTCDPQHIKEVLAQVELWKPSIADLHLLLLRTVLLQSYLDLTSLWHTGVMWERSCGDQEVLLEPMDESGTR